MKVEKLLNMTLKDILEEYTVLYSPECDYIYGITTQDVAEQLSEKYDLTDEPSLACEPIVPLNVLDEFEKPNEILTFKKIDKFIQDNLMIQLKEAST